MGNTDQDYLELCLNGRPDEFRNLILRYQSALMAYLTGRFGNSTHAEETAQETFVRAFFSLNKVVRGLMALLSDAGAAPDYVTYEYILQLLQ